jgi:sec-independent protein translocase protein TatA
MRAPDRRSASPPTLIASIAMLSLFAFGLGPMEVVVVALVVLLLFGNRLPTLMRSLGQGVVEFKKGVQGVEDDDDQALLKNKAKNNIKEA